MPPSGWFDATCPRRDGRAPHSSLSLRLHLVACSLGVNPCLPAGLWVATVSSDAPNPDFSNSAGPQPLLLSESPAPPTGSCHLSLPLPMLLPHSLLNDATLLQGTFLQVWGTRPSGISCLQGPLAVSTTSPSLPVSSVTFHHLGECEPLRDASC